MKPILTLIMVLAFSLMVKAQAEKTLEVTAGNLAKLLTVQELKSTNKIKLRGTINLMDLWTMKGEMKSLKDIDLSETIFEATIDAATGDTICKSNRIPAYTFSQAVYSVKLPSNITTIGWRVFEHCTLLKDVGLPSSLTTIESAAFWQCNSLASVNIPPQVTTIGEYAFYECTSLKSINLPPLLTSIENNTFGVCTSLVSISIPSSVKAIKEYAFGACAAMTSANIPSSVTTIGEGAFSSCVSLASISIPSVKTINDRMFSDCIALTRITIPSVISIKSYAFNNCDHLQSVLLPRSLTFIGEYAFSGCKALKEITLPSARISVGSWAFTGCDSLASITIPPTVKFISSNAFPDCKNLKAIYAQRAVPLDLETPTFSGMDKSACILHVPFGSGPRYAVADEWKEFATIVEDSTGFYASAYAIRMEASGGETSITLLSNVAWQASSDQPWLKISPEAGNTSETLTITAEASDLTTNRTAKITISAEAVPSQVIRVTQVSDPEIVPLTAGNLTFLYSTAEKQAMISLSLSGTINAWDLFSIQKEMPALTDLDLSKTATKEVHGLQNIWYLDNWMPGSTIENSNPAYELTLSKPLLTTLKLPDSLEMIGCYALKGCSGLTSLEIPSTVHEIGYGAFSDCKSLASITIPSSVTYIDREIFAGCNNLKEINIEGPLRSIMRATFKGCTSLDSLVLPSSVQKIYLYAFDSCTSLRSIVLPEFLNEMDIDVFRHCTRLASVYCYSYDPPITNYSFTDVDQSTCILYVPNGSRSLYASAEDWKEFQNIVEMPAFRLSTTAVYVKNGQDNISRATIEADVPWTATSNQPWLTVNPVSATGNSSITFTADQNPSAFGRVARVTVSAAGMISRTFKVIQDGLPKKIHLSAGDLSSVLTQEELNGIVNLTVTGQIDVRDFMTMNDKMPLLSVVDMGGATITAYLTGSPTYWRNRVNEIPYEAFVPLSVFMGESSLTSVMLPRSTHRFKPRAFAYCTGLTSITLPSSVDTLDENAFTYCVNLISIYSYAPVPPYIWDYRINSFSPFFKVNKDTCRLFVPYGSKKRYAQASIWKDFNNIIEMPGFLLSDDTVNIAAKQGSNSTLAIDSDVLWTSRSDEPWLSVSPASGKGNLILTFSADANLENTPRMAILTFSAPGTEDQTLAVIQMGIITQVAETNYSSPLINCHPNPFATETAIAITNPSLKEVTVDVYSISGQKIRTLLKAQKAASIDCTWDGRNESGQNMPGGIYLMKVNGQTQKVVKR